MKRFPDLTPSLYFNDAVDLWHGTTWNHKKDHALISRLMRKIFPHRRQLLIKDLIPLSGLLQQYPMLCSEEQLSLICYLGLFGSR